MSKPCLLHHGMHVVWPSIPLPPGLCRAGWQADSPLLFLVVTRCGRHSRSSLNRTRVVVRKRYWVLSSGGRRAHLGPSVPGVSYQAYLRHLILAFESAWIHKNV